MKVYKFKNKGKTKYWLWLGSLLVTGRRAPSRIIFKVIDTESAKVIYRKQIQHNVIEGTELALQKELTNFLQKFEWLLQKTTN
jgi:hypothetical protein